MKIPFQAAAAITLIASQVAHAQGAVQWKVSDGGNGHWYGILTGANCQQGFQAMASQRGGHLVSIMSAEENQFVHAIINGSTGFWTYIGFAQDPSGAEPSSGWRWLSGEPVLHVGWGANEPNNGGTTGQDEDSVIMFPGLSYWVDAGACVTDQAVIEWSADCNADGIVDYGQCRDGSLPDYDGDNIPDCCEAGAPCVVGNYPVQWRVKDGGNGHWYAVDLTPLWWDPWNQRAASLGAQLASVTSLSEQQHVVSLIGPMTNAGYPQLLWLGALRRQCSWSWTSGEPWNFTSWAQGNPNGGCIDAQLGIFINQTQPEYNLGWDDCICPSNGEPTAAMLEWSADCNGDGIVDYGQILQGQLADTNADGVPDICQGPICADADIYRDFNVNGADLGILLSQWGPNTPLTESDLNRDGVVNGADLGLLLSFWGACP